MIGPKLATARAAGALSRRAGRGGTSLPGKVLLRLEPDAIATLSARLPHGSVAISATNGKTTTAAIVAAILARAEGPVVHNVQGANMAGGVASALLDASHGKRIDGEIGLFEVDEFWLDRVAPQLQPRALLLGNLFRDQLDRYGELETIADRWAAVLDRLPGTRLVLNADDPLVADLGPGREEPLYFGIDDDNVALARPPPRVGLQALPPLRNAARVRRGLRRASRALALPARGLRPSESRRHRREHPPGGNPRRAAAPADAGR